MALFFTEEFVTSEHSESSAPGLPVSWDKLAIGNLVIAQDTKPENGWWEAEIVEINGEQLTLQWRDYPRQSNVKRSRTAVALLSPAPPQKS